MMDGFIWMKSFTQNNYGRKCNKKLQNLLGVGYPYPQVLDTTKSAN